MKEPSYVMICCACGAEQVVKESIAPVGWRPSFSRPGFVTAKHDEVSELPRGVFIRTQSRSIGSVRGPDANPLIAKIADQLEKHPDSSQPFDQLHVWPKDRAPIGRFGFEPGIDEVSNAVAEEIFRSLQDRWLRCDAPNRIAESGHRVLDVVLVEPAHWFIGWHRATDWHSRWPGGVQPIEPKYEPISRAYFKAAEAITWSGFDLRAGQTAIEIGSAPGGACGRLLELGLNVIGIDPADMDERIMGHPRFRHIRARAGDLPRKEFRNAKWLLVDSNVKPEKTLVTIKNIVMNHHCKLQGLLVTLKIGDYRASGLIDDWTETIQQWNPSRVRVRQLSRNKVEVCFAITMDRQRRQ